MTDSALALFSEPTRRWFRSAFAAPTAAQQGAWSAIASGGHALVIAPTGSGKTLAAFLHALDGLVEAGENRPGSDPPASPRGVSTLYISPLKALGVDVARNLRSPLAGIRRQAQSIGHPLPDITVGIRTGDTPARERRQLLTRPPDILITTPESLYLMLTSRTRETLTGVRTVIVDEIHAVAGTKRGAHLALSLERLTALAERPPQRIGLSATVRPADTVAGFLGGVDPVSVVAAPSDKTFDIRIVVPVPDLTDPGASAPLPVDGPEHSPDGVAPGADSGPGSTTTDPEPADTDAAPHAEDDFFASAVEAGPDPRRERSVWPHVESRLVDLIAEHHTTLVFANSRRLAERLTGRLNEMWAERTPDAAATDPPLLARAHHGSVSKEQRAQIEDLLKAGRLPAVVATSSLELGIDMGSVDVVAQVAAPPSVASGLQRIGRAGHQVGAVSRGVIFPRHRGDLLVSAVVAEGMVAGEIETLSIPHNPLDVLAQHIVSMVAMDDWEVPELARLVRRAAPFGDLPDSALHGVLDMLAGRYPADEFASLRPRLNWDRGSGVLTARKGAQHLAVIEGGTIPDRGLFGVYLAGGEERGNRRVGELDEEMVYESRVGDVFSLGASSWRIEDITPDRVLVSPAPGQPGRLPFWHGDALGRPYELGRALGSFVRELAGDPEPNDRLRRAGLDDWAADNLLAYLADQRAATGRVPDDRTIVVERFRDELGDWRIVLHSPFGARVNAAWSLALAARLQQEYDVDAQVMPGDDGIIARLPDTDERDLPARVVELAFPDAAELTALVTAQVTQTALFAARFRECAARALLLPRRDPSRRSPLWQQRQRASQLLAVASRYPQFPITLETAREVMREVYDLPALQSVLTDIAEGRITVVDVETSSASPFARSLLFDYVAEFMYEGDSPLAERRAAALTLDTEALAELLGEADLRDLLDEESIRQVEASLQWLTDPPRVRDTDTAADLLRDLGPLTTAAALRRGADDDLLRDLLDTRRAFLARIGGEEHYCAVEDAARLRDGLGVALPVGLPESLLVPVEDPLTDLVARYARTHGPFIAEEAGDVLGLHPAVVTLVLRELAARGTVVSGAFTRHHSGTEWCDATVLRRIRRASVSALQHQAEPVPPEALGRFLPRWQAVIAVAGGSGVEPRGVDDLLDTIDRLAGAPVPASSLETLVLPSRLADYSPGMLDELLLTGEVEWWGVGALPGRDGWIALAPTDLAAELRAAQPPTPEPEDPDDRAVWLALRDSGGWFLPDLAARLAEEHPHRTPTTVLASLWRLTWSGHVRNDTLGPLRSWLAGGPGGRARPSTPRRARPRTRRPLGRVATLAPAEGTGRWSAIPHPEPSTHATLTAAERLLHRHGVVVKGSMTVERTEGGFAAAYRVLSRMDEAGRCRRIYLVDGLGGAQFAAAGAVDRLRALSTTSAEGMVDVLAAADPANPYGAALAWPPPIGDHRPGRKAGAVVVLVDGQAALYLEKGGRTLVTFTLDRDVLDAAARALNTAAGRGILGRVRIERVDSQSLLESRQADSVALRVLLSTGFRLTPRGLSPAG